jgi:hypothetical protein
VRRHVVLDQQRITSDPADQLGRVPSGIEIALGELAVVVDADGVVALADVHLDLHGQALDCEVDRLDRGPDLVVSGDDEQRLIDLDVPASGLLEAPEVAADELGQIQHHRPEFAVMLVVGDLGQHVRPGHGHLDIMAGVASDHAVLVDQAEVRVIADPAATDRGGVQHVRILDRDRPGPGLTLKRGNALPEEVEHGVRRRMAVAGAPVHLAAGDDVDAGALLVEDRRLDAAVLGVGHVRPGEGAALDLLVERLVPARHAVRAHHRGRVAVVSRHARPHVRAACATRSGH